MNERRTTQAGAVGTSPRKARLLRTFVLGMVVGATLGVLAAYYFAGATGSTPPAESNTICGYIASSTGSQEATVTEWSCWVPTCHEDMPCWDCETMGNKQSGPDAPTWIDTPWEDILPYPLDQVTYYLVDLLLKN